MEINLHNWSSKGEAVPIHVVRSRAGTTGGRVYHLAYCSKG